MLRRFLDWLYDAAGAVAAIFLMAIVAIVLGQVILNIVNALGFRLFGQASGFSIPGYAELAGYFLSGSVFLGLAPTLRSGGHIRVGLLISGLKGPARRLVLLWSVIVAGGLSAFASVHMLAMVRESYEFGDLAQGLLPIPLWIPQSLPAAGLLVLAVALADQAVGLLSGDDTDRESVEKYQV